MDAQPQLKGASYLSTLAFIDERFGADGHQRVLARVPDEDRAFFEGLILPISWYPLAPFPRLLRALDEELGRGDGKLAEERGIWAAIRDMKTTHRILLKLASPTWVVHKATSLWKNFHTTGTWETKPDGPNAAHATLRDLAIVDAALCATLGGWIIGLLTVSGCKHIHLTHTACRAHGAPACAYHVTWR